MNLAARLAILERQRPPPPAPPVDVARLDTIMRACCAVYADEGADELRHLLEQNGQLRPDQHEPIVRLARNLVERVRRGDPLSARQRAIVGMVIS